MTMIREQRQLREAQIERKWARTAAAAGALTAASTVCAMFAVPMTRPDGQCTYGEAGTNLGIALILLLIFACIGTAVALVWVFATSRNTRAKMDAYNDSCERTVT